MGRVKVGRQRKGGLRGMALVVVVGGGGGGGTELLKAVSRKPTSPLPAPRGLIIMCSLVEMK